MTLNMNINIDFVFRLKRSLKLIKFLNESSKHAPLIVNFKCQAFKDSIVSWAKDLSRIKQYENVFTRYYRTIRFQSH